MSENAYACRVLVLHTESVPVIICVCDVYCNIVCCFLSINGMLFKGGKLPFRSRYLSGYSGRRRCIINLYTLQYTRGISRWTIFTKIVTTAAYGAHFGLHVWVWWKYHHYLSSFWFEVQGVYICDSSTLQYNIFPLKTIEIGKKVNKHQLE